MQQQDIENLIIDSWKQNYIDYINLNKLLSSIDISDFNSDNFNNLFYNKTNKESYSNNNDMLTESSNELNNKSKDSISLFMNFLGSEIKKIFCFYASVERELYLMINSRINYKFKYIKYGLKQIEYELTKYKQILDLSYSLIKFTNLNLNIIHETVIKFRELYGEKKADIIHNFIQNQLDEINSDLSYILKFKIIDEISVVLYKYITFFEIRIKKEKTNILYSLKNDNTNENLKSSILEKNENYISNTNIVENSINNNNNYYPILVDDIDKANSFNNKKLLIKNTIIPLINSLKESIECIDLISIEFRNESNDVNNFINFNNKIIVNQVTHIAQTAKRSFIFVGFDEFTNKNILSDSFMLKQQSQYLSREAKINIFIILVHSLLHMIITNIPISTFLLYFFVNGFNFPVSCYVIGISPLFNPISNIIGLKLSSYNIKIVYIISITFMIISCLCYGLFENFNYIALPIISRILIGLSSIRSVSRQYILENMPSIISQKVSLKFQLCTHFGTILGFGLSFILALFNREDYLISKWVLSKYSTPMYLMTIILIVFLIMTIIAFTLDSGYDYKDNEFIDEEDCKNNNELNNNSLINKDNDTKIVLNEKLLSKKDTIKSFVKNKKPKKKVFTKDEQIMVRSINNKLNEYNNKAAFTTTNFLQKELNDINNDERKGISSICKSFLILTYNIVNYKITSDILLIYMSLYLYENAWNNTSQWQICLIIFLSVLIVVPVFLLSLNTYNTNLLVYSNILLCCLCFSLIFVSNYIYSICTFPIIIFASFYSELYSSKLFMQIIPYDYKVFKFDCGQLLTFISGFGKSIFIYLLGIIVFYEHKFANISIIVFSITSFRMFTSLIFNLLFKKYLKIKALSRLMNSFESKTL